MLERPFAVPARPSERPARTGMAGWVWPVVAAVALVVGLLGGALGGSLVEALTDDDVAGMTDGGLDDVDLEDRAPLDKPGSVSRVAQTVLPSSVQILAELDGVEGGATGSGFVLDRNGHVVTNNHVIESAAENDGPIEVVDHEGNTHSATVVGRSAVYDLAVLHVTGAEDLKPAKLGHSRKLRVGEPVVAIGSPLGLSATVTSGIVSALNRPVSTGNSGDQSSYINAVQTDAAINPGNSGGPLVNLTGEVVGVNSAIATNGGGTVDGDAGNIGVGFAIPVEQVRVTVDQILKTGEAQYPKIGAQVQTGGPTEFDGATIEEVENGSPADDAGLEDGDVVTHVNGQRVTDGLALIVAIRTYQPNQTIELTVERGEETVKVRVKLEGVVG
jgi:putative serine protease PepD